MSDFREKIKINSDTKERLSSISEVYKKSGRELEFRDKIATAVYMAILDVDTENQEEEAEKMEYMNNINKIIYNYEELKPIISEFFINKRNSKLIIEEQKRTLITSALIRTF